MNGFRLMMVLLFSMLVTPVLAEEALSADELEALFQQAQKVEREGRFIEAMGLLEKAAKMGHPGAQNSYGYMMHKSGFFEQSFAMYQKSADQGNSEAMMRLGLQYFSGEGVEVDMEKARTLIEQAARAGNFYAYNAIYEAYKHGSLGYELNEAQALRWLTAASDAGSATHRRLLAQAYENGALGLDVDVSRALDNYKQAAAAGDRPSIQYLYRVYTEGLLEQVVDPGMAEQWSPKPKQQ
ncbi:tetratricopeptide repeat protein [Aestuariirhabdus sp. LZHN29]|uniref:tetratricopeptide repeat protein n=1 Tax=Aestuariirhabdus sp. LZHN29 TaxID=3417462 RepID=UPI003CF6ADCB